MKIINSPAEMQDLGKAWRCGGQTIGFVPTMGALHAGHEVLFARSRQENSRFCASVFVNPTQFGANEDLSKYPRPFERDCEILEKNGCDAVFAPTNEQMWAGYERHSGTWVDVMPFDEMWEGVTRPGHLRGVATVVAKLFNICCATHAYFGEKDYQQLRVIERMVQDLNFPLQIVPVETVREADGLALSSRNAYLAPEERRAAATIFRAMCAGRDAAQAGERNVAKIGVVMAQILSAERLIQPQYVTVVDAKTLAPLSILDGRPARILIAAHVGKTRLIDNLALS